MATSLSQYCFNLPPPPPKKSHYAHTPLSCKQHIGGVCYSFNIENNRVATHLEVRVTFLMKLKKFNEIHEKLRPGGGGDWFANILENVDIAHFISIFCQRIRFSIVTYVFTADKLGACEKHCRSGKLKKTMATLNKTCICQDMVLNSIDRVRLV